MLRRTKGSTFFLDDEADQISHESKKNQFSSRSSSSSSNKNSSSDSVGLRILIDDQYQSNSHQELNNNIVLVKPTFRLGGSSSTTSTKTHRRIAAAASSQESNFLKACSLCKKKLNPQKDVYMYRGDQGFCSVDCRCRQMLIDEIREIEASTKEILASSRHSPTDVWFGGIPERRRGGIPAAA